MIKYIKIVVCFLFALGIFMRLSASPPLQKDAAEIQLALKKLNVLGSALYIAAHPDDENTALLAYLEDEKLVRAGYLALTRGSGGQNLIGSEKGELLGVIRTQELLAARRLDGAEQFFTRAIDFGYSKSPEESIEIWGHDKILSDVVWVIRKFRPDIILTRFTPKIGGHGHHLASARLAIEAFNAAGDSSRFPSQLKYVDVWQPKRVFWNAWRPALGNDSAKLTQLPHVDLGTYNPLLGKSYGEIAAKSRSMHKSQGFGVGARRGSYQEYFIPLAGDTSVSSLFQGIDLSWSRVPGSLHLSELLKEIYKNFKPENPSASLPDLLQAYSEMQKLGSSYWVDVKLQELRDIIRECGGLYLSANAARHSYIPGDSVDVDISVLNRSGMLFKITKLILPFNSDTVLNRVLADNLPLQFHKRFRLPDTVSYTQPYWLAEKPRKGTYTVTNQKLIGLAQRAPRLAVTFQFNAGGVQLAYRVPMNYRWVDPVKGEKYRAVEIIPRVTIKMDEDVFLFPDKNSHQIDLHLKGHLPNVTGSVFLNLPANWKCNPASRNFTLQAAGDETSVGFLVTPPSAASQAVMEPVVKTGGKQLSYKIDRIDYPYIPQQTVVQPIDAKLIRLHLEKRGTHLGYIMGSGDDIPGYLRQLNYDVTLLTDADLDTANLQQFDAIIAGIRAYNTRQALKHTQERLMEYVRNGGTYIVQYTTTRGLITKDLGPYPFELSHDRVSVEEAPVTFLKPDSPLLNFPNKITPADFEDWVQERGLYFADEWDQHYQPMLSSHDPNETPKEGELLYATYGKGVFIYTGLSFFRQLPAGVPGAYRLFVNLISARQRNER